MSLSASPVSQTGISGVYHSTFESLRLGRSSQSIASGLIRFWDSLNFKKDNSVIHEFTPAGRTNHYMPSLKVGFIVKIDRFEVASCLSMYKITDHSFLICFISPTIIDEVATSAPEISHKLFDNLQVIVNTNLELPNVVGQICYVQGSDSPKKQLESLSASLLIRKKQSTHNSLYIIIYILETNTTTPGDTRVPTDSKATTTFQHAHSSCLMKIAYISNVNTLILLSSYEKYINSFEIH
ncbi:hypothetical protein IGI04_018970 [Brassica rapa subsp. trilocularis]|uniref:DUF223 domain-containing protein n=1 Tax=Brassica rapa subsp. trilocularis TaxID=1813537 RepID=A0ABQ7MEH3_BRACM|nr:hypothetical protein IGI04_018970 [Brassica rapa subsp. trilocularis]